MSEGGRLEALEERLEALEKLVAEFSAGKAGEAVGATEVEPIPWGVLAAAVAALFPEQELKSLSVVAVHARPAGRSWSLSGKLDHFQSHRIR